MDKTHLAIKILKKNISINFIRKALYQLPSIKEQRSFMKNKIDELKRYKTLLGKYDENVLIRLILLKDSHRKQFHKEKLPIIAHLRLSLSLQWLTDVQRHFTKKRIPTNRHYKFRWIKKPELLKVLYDELYKYYLDKNITYNIFKQHFYFDQADDNKLYIKPEKKSVGKMVKRTKF